ncbi:MAG TPA: hypothetical protein VJ020_04565 [Anaerolineales bacterium]|nr:hypothetical protein [Anaerolineales bacterium]
MTVTTESSGNKLTLGIAIGCLAGCLAAVVATLCLGGVLLGFLTDEPENVSIDVSAPLTISRGESFTIEVQLENSAGQAQSLDSIDIDLTYLDGIAIERTDPPFTETIRNDLVSGLAFQSYYFEHDIPIGGTLTVTFSAVALKAGDFAGDLDVCINSSAAFRTFPIRTVVGE